ncbi:MAG: hypothetical protein AB7N76_33895 [Planctomycetota bacterium]
MLPGVEEPELVKVRGRGAPLRCPFCHEDVDHERERWVACRGCLARHHTACWDEAQGCAECGETRSLAPEAPSAPRVAAQEAQVAAPLEDSELAALPALGLALRAERERHAPVDATLRLLVRPGREERVALEIENQGPEPQQVTLRQLPPWLRPLGPAGGKVGPGEVLRLALAVDAGALPRQRPQLGDPRGQHGSLTAAEGAAQASFVVSGDDDARTVEVRVWTEPRTSWLVGVGLGLGAMPPLGVLLAGWTAHVWLVGAVLAGGPSAAERQAPADEAEGHFLRRLADADRRATGVLFPCALAMLALIVAVLSRI